MTAKQCNLTHKTCPICKTPMTCGIEPNKNTCWCDELPYIMPASFEQDCCCKTCLTEAIKARIEKTIEEHNLPELLMLAKPFYKPDTLIKDIDYTLNNQDAYVFSQWYHLKRGSCCGNNCQNCPY